MVRRITLEAEAGNDLKEANEFINNSLKKVNQNKDKPEHSIN